MSLRPLVGNKTTAIPIWFVSETQWASQCEALPAFASLSAKTLGFKAKIGHHLVVLDQKGALGGVLFGVAAPDAPYRDPFAVGVLPALLPDGVYKFGTLFPDLLPDTKLAALAWLLGSYSFTDYTKKSSTFAQLVLPEGIDAHEVTRIAEAVVLGRDLVNTPTCDLGPDGIEEAAIKLANKHNAKIKTIKGDKLLDKNFPLIHAVGRASSVEPRLISISWGEKKDPLITVIGKGVAFDTGGLDIKPSGSMLLMKKDMGGAAAALALGDMVMGANLPIRLKILIPAVENSISGNAFRPGDIIRSRKGISVEIGNTDAEGRLILADALALADEEQPDLLVDFATLTGAARVAVGPDLPPFYTKDDGLAREIQKIGYAVHDPVWRLPLWEPYQSYISSDFADINNSSNAPFAGSITAALFLNRFVERAKSYVHFDIFAWTPSARPARPKGGEVQGARLIYELLKQRYQSR